MRSWQKIQKSTKFSPKVSQVDDFQVRPFAPPQQENDFENQRPPQSTATNLNWSFGNILVSREKAFSGEIQVNLKSSQEQESDRLFSASASLASPVQAKLNIGQPGDKYELEADRVASQVVEQINASTVSTESTKDQSLQRQEEAEEEELQTKPTTVDLQREAMPEEEEELQAKSILQPREAIGGEASTDLESTINRAKGGGQSLDAGLQQKMGQVMGANFSEVRVHTDAESDQLNQSIQARAFTTGQDVFFRQGEYNPESREGQELIAHELTHVVQQHGLDRTLQRKSLQNNFQTATNFTDIGNGTYATPLETTGIEVSQLVGEIHAHMLNNESDRQKLIILSGCHGDPDGNLYQDGGFYWEDKTYNEMKGPVPVSAKNIRLKSKNMCWNEINNSNVIIILAWCHSKASYENWNNVTADWQGF